MTREANFNPRKDYEHCWYREVCDRCDSDSCTYNCKRFEQTDYLFQMSNLPKNWWKPIKVPKAELDEHTLEILETIRADIDFFVKKGFNLYLFGGEGTGKTSWAIRLMNSYIAEIAERNNFVERVLFVSVPSFLSKAKLHITSPSRYYIELLNSIEKVDLVVWDEIGQTDKTNFEAQLLYSCINERLFAKKANIFTGNVEPEKMKAYDLRLASRICNNSDCLEFNGLDKRFMNTYEYYMNNIVEEDTNNGSTPTFE